MQLGLAGAMPFAALAILTFFFGWAANYLLLYASIILAFMGGIHWGCAMNKELATLGRLGSSVAPALIAWAAVSLGGYSAFFILATAFALLLAYDLYATRIGLVPGWYPSLRIPLTLIVVASLLLAASTTDFATATLAPDGTS